MSFSDAPLDIIGEIIDDLQDDSAALKACSLTCLSLLPLCRKYIFRTITLMPRSRGAKFRGLPRYITLLGNLLDTNSQIADYVRNLVYGIEVPDFKDESVPRILDKLHQIQSFRFAAHSCINWGALRPDLQESLSRMIHTMTHLDITFIPIDIFIPCISLINLRLDSITGTVTDGYEHGYFGQDAVPQLQSPTLGNSSGRYTQSLVEAKRSKDVPVLDFSNLRTLSVRINKGSDFTAFHTLMKVTKKLETLDYMGAYQFAFIYLSGLTLIALANLANGCRNLAVSMNPSSFSTLRRLHLIFLVEDDVQDPLCGICHEFTALSGHNVIEEIILEIVVQIDCQCKTDNEWRKLDDVLATGFPRLSQVSLSIEICVFSCDGTILQKKLDKLPGNSFRGSPKIR